MGGFSVSASDVILNSFVRVFWVLAYQNGAFSWAFRSEYHMSFFNYIFHQKSILSSHMSF